MTDEREERERRDEIERRFAARFDVIADPDVEVAVRDFYGTFYDPEKMIRWWAGLYDPDLGGFYYANSARDTEGYLPDMESTFQIVQRLRVLDPRSDLAAFLGPAITEKMIRFYREKQDPGDGYFYHPQWTKEQSRKKVMRYTRDLDWTVTVLGWLHSAPLYPTALDRAESGDGVSTEWEPNARSVSDYVYELMKTRSCESWSNTLQTQASAFEATGTLGAVLDVLDERSDPAYGLWVSGYDPAQDVFFNLKETPESEVPYGLYTCAYKVMIMYNAGKRLVPNASRLIENAIRAILSRDPGARVTYIFNPWATLGLVRENLVNYGTPEAIAEYDGMIKHNILKMLDALKGSLGKYKRDDGSYSFLQSGSSPTIYGTPVSTGALEGDVNGNNLVVSFARHICHTVGLERTIPVFSPDHGKLMRELLDNAPKIKKTRS